MSRSPHRFTYYIILVLLSVLSAQPALADSHPLNRLEPQQGTYFGVGLDFGNDSLAAYSRRLGYKPAVSVQFFAFPFTEGDLIELEKFISQAALTGSMGIVTLEPFEGLHAITPEVAQDLAIRLAAANAAGVPVFVRFAHEMNGSWYPWGHQPILYREKFRLIAEAVYAHAPQTAMLWAPNYGGGYPFSGGTFEAQPGTPEFEELDTNGDGVLNMEDDMYAPYYPGDDVVDWVGMSLYHWGNTYPWRENEIPEANKFVHQLRGEYNGLNGDDRAVPDFYYDYALSRNKPVAIPETAALYNTELPGADEFIIKRAWWRQVYSESTLVELPMLKMICWFEHRKQESEIQNALIDWSVTLNSSTAQAYVEDLPMQRLIFSGEVGPVYTAFLPQMLGAAQ